MGVVLVGAGILKGQAYANGSGRLNHHFTRPGDRWGRHGVARALFRTDLDARVICRPWIVHPVQNDRSEGVIAEAGARVTGVERVSSRLYSRQFYLDSECGGRPLNIKGQCVESITLCI